MSAAAIAARGNEKAKSATAVRRASAGRVVLDGMVFISLKLTVFWMPADSKRR
jgi:hypothetical protein